jgi:hypothetical protein
LKAAFRARKQGRFERLFTVFFLCNGSAIKGRGLSSIGSNTYSLKAAVTTGSGLIKEERSEPMRKRKQKQRDGETGNERKTGRDRGQKPIKQRPIQAVNPENQH